MPNIEHREGHILNGVAIEGLLTGKSWSYAGDLLFRLASYRDRQRPGQAPIGES